MSILEREPKIETLKEKKDVDIGKGDIKWTLSVRTYDATLIIPTMMVFIYDCNL